MRLLVVIVPLLVLACASSTWGQEGGEPAPQLRLLASPSTGGGGVIAPVHAIRGAANAALEIDTATGTVRLPAGSLVYAEALHGSSRRPGGQWLALTNGTLLFGSFERVEEGVVVFDSTLAGEQRVPLARVVAFSLARGVDAAALLFGGEAVVLANGDLLEGALESIESDGVRAESIFGTAAFAWDELQAVVLRRLASDAGGPDILVLLDGHELRGTVEAFEGERVRIHVDGVSTLTAPLAELRQACLAGRRLSRVTQRDPTIQSSGTYTVGQAVDGGPLRIGPRWYRDGLGAREARVVFPLPEDAEWLLVDAGIDARAGEQGRVRFRVEANGEVVAGVEQQRDHHAQRLAAPLNGARLLALRTQPQSPHGGLAVWGEPWVLHGR